MDEKADDAVVGNNTPFWHLAKSRIRIGEWMGKDRQVRIDEAVAQFRAALSAGRAPSSSEWVARHPDLVPELERALSGSDTETADDHSRTNVGAAKLTLNGAEMGRLWKALRSDGTAPPGGAVDSKLLQGQ